VQLREWFQRGSFSIWWGLEEFCAPILGDGSNAPAQVLVGFEGTLHGSSSLSFSPQ